MPIREIRGEKIRRAPLGVPVRCAARAIPLINRKTATVADLRNNFRRVSAWLANGESVEIIKRGKSFARLTPTAAGPDKPAKVGFKAQLRAVWGDKVFTAAEVRGMREAEADRQSPPRRLRLTGTGARSTSRRA